MFLYTIFATLNPFRFFKLYLETCKNQNDYLHTTYAFLKRIYYVPREDQTDLLYNTKINTCIIFLKVIHNVVLDLVIFVYYVISLDVINYMKAIDTAKFNCT